jgi:hypothetical protein
LLCSLRCDHVPSYRIPSKQKKKEKRRAVTDDSTSSESETDSELELYRGATDGLNPLQRRMIRAKVKRDLARQAGADLPPSDDDNDNDDQKQGHGDQKRFTHSFYAVEETSEERKKRHKQEKRDAKRARKARRHAEREPQQSSATGGAASSTPTVTQGGMSNPFLAAKLREMARQQAE